MRAQLPIPKPGRQTDRRFLTFVREHDCVVCGRHEVDAHHLDSRGSGGSDYSCVPLCRRCHDEYHQRGRATFESDHSILLWRENSRLLAAYILRLLSRTASLN